MAGGCDVLDIKEPDRGSLGMAAVESINEIIEVVASSDFPIPISAALGETADWFNSEAVPAIPVGLQYVKLGTAGLNHLADWQAAWMSVRNRFAQKSAGSCRWIAVAYADWERADGPAPDAVLSAAAETGCAGVLLDTYHKDSRTVFDELQPDRLLRLIGEIRERGIIAAIAGSLTIADVPRAVALEPDVIAVRTAACADGERSGSICEKAVRRLRESVTRFHGSTPAPHYPSFTTPARSGR